MNVLFDELEEGFPVAVFFGDRDYNRPKHGGPVIGRVVSKHLPYVQLPGEVMQKIIPKKMTKDSVGRSLRVSNNPRVLVSYKDEFILVPLTSSRYPTIVILYDQLAADRMRDLV